MFLLILLLVKFLCISKSHELIFVAFLFKNLELSDNSVTFVLSKIFGGKNNR